jgi:membrane protein YdbS with pleckstrin-like domain
MAEDPSEQSPPDPDADRSDDASAPGGGEAPERDSDATTARAGSGSGSASDATTPATGEDVGQSEPDVAEYTTDVRTLDPAVRWLWIGRALLVGLVFGAIVGGVSLAVAPAYVWLGAVVFGLVAVLGAVHAVLLYRSWEYRVREDSVYLDRGVLTKVRTVVPYVRVQHIDTSRGPVERAAGLSSLVIYTAGSRGADVTIPGLVPEESSDLQTRLKVLAIESEGEDAV